LDAKIAVYYMEMRARIALRKAGNGCNPDEVAAEVQKIKKDRGLEVSKEDVLRALSRGEEVHPNSKFY
jgi:hypothetical protein